MDAPSCIIGLDPNDPWEEERFWGVVLTGDCEVGDLVGAVPWYDPGQWGGGLARVHEVERAGSGAYRYDCAVLAEAVPWPLEKAYRAWGV